MVSAKQSVRCVVLRTVNVGESDLILSMLTDLCGKIDCIAKSARRSKRRFAGGLDLFDSGVAEIGPLRGSEQLLLLHSFVSDNSRQGLRADLSAMSFAAFCLESTQLFCADGDPEGSQVFNPLVQCLDALNQFPGRDNALRISVHFLARLLDLSGLSPVAEGFPLEEDCRTWLRELLIQGPPAPPSQEGTVEKCAFRVKGHDSGIAERTLRYLVMYMEASLGHRMKSAASIMG